jgi:hypothetical protein
MLGGKFRRNLSRRLQKIFLCGQKNHRKVYKNLQDDEELQESEDDIYYGHMQPIYKNASFSLSQVECRNPEFNEEKQVASLSC